ncbi:MAG: cysteine desulfurase-like protein [Vicinamibacterales bacterium]
MSTPTLGGTSAASSRDGAVAPVEAIRQHFPALARLHRGHPVAYFDGPGGTQVPTMVTSAMVDYLLHHNANTHWHYPTSAETDHLIASARRALADFLNAHPDEIVFGANMTTLTLHVGRALGRGFRAGDEVIVTELDHHANSDTWRALAADRALVVKTVPMDPTTGTLVWSELERAFTPRTKLLAIGAASNALGTITDVQRASRLAHEHGALAYVDAVHFAAHAPVDVAAIDCDFLACSAYKFYGPHIGVLYGKRALLEEMDAPRLDPAPTSAPDRLETGTQNHEGIVGAAAAVDFLASLTRAASRRAALTRVMSVFHERGQQQVQRLWDGLSDIAGVTLYGPPPGGARTSTVSFALRTHSSDDVARALVEDGVFVSNGDFYASTVIRRIGHEADGVVRVGCACYTTDDEIDRLIAGVHRLSRP